MMQLTFHLSASPDRVFETLSDPVAFARLHPLIESIRPVGEGSHRVRERFAGLPFPLHFSYPAWIGVEPATRSVTFDLRIFRLVSVTLAFRVEADGGGSRVQESVSIRSFLPVARTLSGVLADTHAVLFEELDREQSGGPEGLGARSRTPPG